VWCWLTRRGASCGAGSTARAALPRGSHEGSETATNAVSVQVRGMINPVGSQPSKPKMPVRSRSPAPSKTCSRQGSIAPQRISKNPGTREKSTNTGRQPQLKGWGCLPEDPASLAFGRVPIQFSTPDLRRRPEPAIPVGAHGVCPARRGDRGPLTHRVCSGSRSCRWICAPDGWPDHRQRDLIGIPRRFQEVRLSTCARPRARPGCRAGRARRNVSS